jgi:hypothetical protein
VFTWSNVAMQDENDNYCTTDLGLAATLLCVGCKLEALDKSNSRRALFIFEQTSDLNRALNNYWQDSAVVNPRAYFDSIRMLKSRLYGTRYEA